MRPADIGRAHLRAKTRQQHPEGRTLTIETVLVSGQLFCPDGSPAANVDVFFTLSGVGIAGVSLLVPKRVSVKCDMTGAFALPMVPSPPGTFYAVRALRASALLLSDSVVVPQTDCQFTQILQTQPYPPIDSSQQALLDLQAAQAEIEAVRLYVTELANRNNAARISGDPDNRSVLGTDGGIYTPEFTADPLSYYILAKA